jgi:hypothetical protein
MLYSYESISSKTGRRVSPERSASLSEHLAVERFADRLGIAATSLCAVHCLALTIVLWLSPIVWIRREAFGVPVGWLFAVEVGFAAVGIAAAVFAFGSGYRVHRRLGPGALFAAGAGLLGVGVFGPLHYVRFWGTATVLLAGALLVSGHLWNLRLSRAACRVG